MTTLIRATTGAPVRFVASLVVLWTGARVAALWVPDLMPPSSESGLAPPVLTSVSDGGPSVPELSSTRPVGWAERRVGSMASHIVGHRTLSTLNHAPPSVPVPSALLRPSRAAAAFRSVALILRGDQGSLPSSLPPPVLAASPMIPVSQPLTGRHQPVSFDGFVFLRRGGFANPVEPTLGGSQALMSARYTLSSRVAVTGRLVSAIAGGGQPRQSEAAVGVGVRPLTGVPVELVAERRIAFSDGARNAWQLRAVGGASTERAGWRLEGYGQAGVVGTRSRALFADGQVRVSRAVLGPVSVGALAAGAAQPGAARLDVGPQLRLDFGPREMPLALLVDYRVRIAGSAAPGNGPALTLATSF